MEVKQIHRYYNLANFMIKTKFSFALKMLIDSNYINITITKQVKYANMKQVNISIQLIFEKIANIAILLAINVMFGLEYKYVIIEF